MFRKTAIAAAMCLAAMPAFAALNPLVCDVYDNQGSRIDYSFVVNSTNADGSLGGTIVETAFSKNGRQVAYPIGKRPIWVWRPDGSNANFYPRNDPGWALVLQGPQTQNGVMRFPAVLVQGQAARGQGFCYIADLMPTAATVPDLGGY